MAFLTGERIRIFDEIPRLRCDDLSSEKYASVPLPEMEMREKRHLEKQKSAEVVAAHEKALVEGVEEKTSVPTAFAVMEKTIWKRTEMEMTNEAVQKKLKYRQADQKRRQQEQMKPGKRLASIYTANSRKLHYEKRIARSKTKGVR